jgi:hypothetical protein
MPEDITDQISIFGGEHCILDGQLMSASHVKHGKIMLNLNV